MPDRRNERRNERRPKGANLGVLLPLLLLSVESILVFALSPHLGTWHDLFGGLISDPDPIAFFVFGAAACCFTLHLLSTVREKGKRAGRAGGTKTTR